MAKTCFLTTSLLFLATVFLNPAAPAAQESSYEKGLSWYEQRAAEADSFRAHPKYINNAIDAFEQALEKNIRYEKSGLYLLKSYYFKGMFTDIDKNEQKDVFGKGRDLGEKLEDRYSESAEIKFWYAANMGRWAKVHGFVAAATGGVAKKVRNMGEEIIDLDKEYQGGGGYRILARAHFHSPKIPLLMNWPSDEKAMELVKEAMDIAPEHPSNRLLYAQLLMSFDRNEEAREHLEYIRQIEPRPDYLIPDRYVKHRAEKALNEKFGI